MKVVIVPSLLKFNINMPLKDTFGDEVFTIYQIPVKVSLSYSDESDINELKKTILESIENIENVLRNNEVYLIASGGVLHSCLLVEILKEKNIKFKYLVYNKSDDVYCVIDSYDFDSKVRFVK